jgi:GTPase
MAGLVAIVGRPNVGKSALFNRIAGKRIAIVHDMPGVTRDRVSAEVEWRGRPFTLVDTGGIGLLRGEKSDDIIVKAAMDQVQLAIEAAQVIVFVVDVRDGVASLDLEVAARLRRSGSPVLVAVNKSDTERMDNGAMDFTKLGFEEIFSVSAIQARGVDDLMQRAMEFLPKDTEPRTPRAPRKRGERGEREPDDTLKLAVVGRPNVGKSSLINALTNSERVIVSEIPGTTRDSVDVPFEVDTEGHRQKYLLIDTAGLRKSRRVKESVEFFSTKRTERAIERADITVFVIDAESGILEQDKKIADKITSNNRACVLVVNKWDLVSDEVTQARKDEVARRNSNKPADKHHPEMMTTLGEFAGWVQKKLFFLDYAPVIFTSAKSGFHLDRLLEAVRYVAAQLQQQVSTGLLNRTLRDAIEQKQPIASSGAFLKFFYATHVRKAPPTFVMFFNKNDHFTEAYHKYLQKQLRKAFGFEGCPIVLVGKSRPKKVDSIRTVKKKRVKKSPTKSKPEFPVLPTAKVKAARKKSALKKASKKKAPKKKAAKKVIRKKKT